ncbi:hypothetical protein FQR65_LT20224 [Abscondita terminalis]|nr:hypothetical protein FQR65_LT20224 [Abscondita terminalis]
MAAGAARIRVTFTVDADGLLSVGAREQASGVEAHIHVKPSYGLSDDEVARMLQEGFATAQDDMRTRALVEARETRCCLPPLRCCALRIRRWGTASQQTADSREAFLTPNAGGTEIMLRVTVRGCRGAEQQRDLQVPVEANAAPVFTGTAKTVRVGPALAVTPAPVVDGQLRADVIDHAKIRVAGSTPDGGPGRIGAADVVVPDAGVGGTVAVADTATVRAGAVTDIRVLDNDVAVPGERLVLHPEVTGLLEGETRLRRVGRAILLRSSLSASTVEQSEVRVPLSGVDPDGDRVRLDSVDAGDDARITATIASARNAIAVGAGELAEPGQYWLSYTVSDGQGGTGSGRLQVIVTEQLDAGAPVVSQ